MYPTTTETPAVTVDPGQIIRINARFPGSPAVVRFSYLPPQSTTAIHDPDAHTAGTQIQHAGDDLYYFDIDTRQMRGGLGWWYFVSEDPDPRKRRAKAGQFTIRDVPQALYADENSLLGGVEPQPTSAVPWSMMAASGVAGAALGLLVGRHSASAGALSAHEDVIDVDDASEAAHLAVRPRSADGKFLSAGAPIVDGETDLIDEEDDSSTGSGGTAAWVTIGVITLGALGFWLWRKHRATKAHEIADGHSTPALPAHAQNVGEFDGLDMLGAD
jgi:hypothetical protein